MGNEKDRAEVAKSRQELENEILRNASRQENAYEKMIKKNEEKASPSMTPSSYSQDSRNNQQEIVGKYSRVVQEKQQDNRVGGIREVEEVVNPQPSSYRTVSENTEQKERFMHTVSQEQNSPGSPYMHTSQGADNESKSSFIRSDKTSDGVQNAAGSRVLEANKNYADVTLGAGASKELEAQKEYDMKMRGRVIQEEPSAQDIAIKEKFKNQLSSPRTPINPETAVVVSGGRGKFSTTTASTKVRMNSEHQGITNNSIKARVSNEDTKSIGNGIRIETESLKHNSQIKVDDNNVLNDNNIRIHETNDNLKVHDTNDNLRVHDSNNASWIKSEDTPTYTPQINENTKEYGVHAVGGKCAAGYVTGKDHAVYQTQSVITNYSNIFKNPEIAKKFGITVTANPKTRMQAINISAGKAGRISEEQILFELKQSGYNDESAVPLAKEIHQAVNSEVLQQNPVTIHNDEFFTVVHKAQGVMTKDTNVEIKMNGDKFTIVAPVGITKCKVGLAIERPMRKLTRQGTSYVTGMVEQGGDEAGSGASQTRQAVRIASLLVPSGSAMADKVFSLDLQQHLNGFVVVSMGRGKTQQFTVAEVKNLLAKAGIEKELIDQCNIGADFSKWAGNLLKENAKAPDNKLNEKQVDLLTTLSKSRGAAVVDRRAAINDVLRKYNVEVTGDYGHFSNQKIQEKIRNVIKIYGGKDKVPADLMAALKEELMISEKCTYKNAAKTGGIKGRKIIMILKQQVEKNGSEAGQGLSIATRMANIAPKLVVAGVKAAWLTNVVARELAQKAILFASKGALATAKATNAAAKITGSKKLAKAGNKLNHASLKTRQASAKFKQWNRNTNSKARVLKRDLREKLQMFNPVYRAKKMVKEKMASLWARQLQKKGIGGAVSRGINKVFHGFAKIFKFGGAVKAFIIKIIMIIIGVFFALWFLGCALAAVVGAISALFDANSQEYDTKQYLAKNLESYYEDDMKFITDQVDVLQDASYNPDTNPNVNHVDKINITYEDYKDYDKYKDILMEMESDSFFQSSNNGEILSMALIKFDWDFGTLKDHWYSSDPKPNKQLKDVSEYVQKLYYGSHALSVSIDTKTVLSEDALPEGEVEADGAASYSYNVYTINAIYKTYYFDELFECALANAPQRTCGFSATSGNLTTCGSWDSIYYALRSSGYTHEGASGAMGNLVYESGGTVFDAANSGTVGPNPNAVNSNSGAYGICQWLGGRKIELELWCEQNGFPSNSTTGQIAFMVYEIENKSTYSITRSSMHDPSKSAYQVACDYCQNFEVCGNYGVEFPHRGGVANQIAAHYAAFKDDYSGLQDSGGDIAGTAQQYMGRIHYTQGTGISGCVGRREIDNVNNAVLDPNNPLDHGTDCSGFVRSLYKSLGIPGADGLPTTTGSYPTTYSNPLPISQASPGDIAWKNGHVGIVIGNGQVAALKGKYCKNSPDAGAHGSDAGTQPLSSFDCVYRIWQ